MVGFVRDWAPGDPPVAKGRSLWRDEAGDVWLSPAEVKALGLIQAMREGLDRPSGIGLEPVPEEEARTRDVRAPSGTDNGAVSAEEYFEQEDDVIHEHEGGPDPIEAADRLHDVAKEAHRPDFDSGGRRSGPDDAGHDRAEAWDDAYESALSFFGGDHALALGSITDKIGPRPEPPGQERFERQAAIFDASNGVAPLYRLDGPLPSGETGGWRWWWTEDDGTMLLAYDNRPLVQADAERQGMPRAGERMKGLKLVQGVVPAQLIKPAMLALTMSRTPVCPRCGNGYGGYSHGPGFCIDRRGDEETLGEPEVGPLSGSLGVEDGAKAATSRYERADGRTICQRKDCGRAYSAHPSAEAEGTAGLTLHRLCDGRLVKL
jgi:hypothetical protein